MKSPLLLSSALALGLAAGALALPPLATAADGPGMFGQDRHHDRGGPGGMFAGRHAHGAAFEHVDGGLAFLKAELKITPAQETAWAPFEAAVREQAALAKKNFDARKAQKDQKDEKAPTVPERLARAEERLKFGLSAIEALSDKTDALYAALSDEQKKMADELIPSPLLPFPL